MEAALDVAEGADMLMVKPGRTLVHSFVIEIRNILP